MEQTTGEETIVAVIIGIAMGLAFGVPISSWFLANITLMAGDYFKRLDGKHQGSQAQEIKLPERRAAFNSAALFMFLSFGLLLLTIQPLRLAQSQISASIISMLVVLSVPVILLFLQIVVFRHLFKTGFLNATGITAIYLGLLAFIAAITLGPIAGLVFYLNST
jgi:hypothetical protein